jgi:hypothetical protein
LASQLGWHYLHFSLLFTDRASRKYVKWRPKCDIFRRFALCGSFNGNFLYIKLNATWYILSFSISNYNFLLLHPCCLASVELLEDLWGNLDHRSHLPFLFWSSLVGRYACYNVGHLVVGYLKNGPWWWKYHY